MPYLFIENFEAGLDTRKSTFTAPPGSARVLRNAHITRGKEIEQRKAFADYAELPEGTFGLHSVQDQLYTFGSGAEPAEMPVTVIYQQLTSPNGGGMTELLCAENFGGKIYAVAEYDDGSVHHFYDGTLVDDWETLADSLGSTSTVATALGQRLDESDTVNVRVAGARIVLTSAVAGTAFVVGVTANMTAVELQAAVAAQDEVQAIGSFEITGGSTGPTFNTVAAVEVDGIDLLGGPVNFDTDAATTATAVAARINAYTSGYSAAAVGAEVNITAPANLGASANGRTVDVSVAGDVTVANIQDMAGGADPVPAVQQITSVTVDSYTESDTYTVTIDGAPFTIRGDSSAMPTTVRAVKEKMYAVTGSLLHFSGLAGSPAQADPTKWIDDEDGTTTGTVVVGAGFINMATQYSGSEDLVGVGVYQDRVCAFSKKNTQIWSVDPDPDLNTLYQVLLNVGAVAPRSIVEYGDIDIFFLGRSGARSLRARDSSNLASASDVGVAIDADLVAAMNNATRRQIRRACAVVEPEDNRYLLALGETVYVFSNFPGSRVSAWSTYELGGTVDAWAISDSRLYCRVGDTVRIYGGLTGDEYDAAYPAVVETPFLDASNPATMKQLEALDAGLIGTWKVEIATEPDNPDAWEEVARINRSTYGSLGSVAVNGQGTHFSVRLTALEAARAVIGNLVVHFRELSTW